ncbi:uncharacterized protein LOC128991276 isoform X2 [Macrosteles quadrilineatus]|uniref:uncharacterized protein LOC128991276 isoform X2 n=1 Tax=Macrosteles quadrilineatus TaxID=74068 RepID=UPI0023E17B24|nr:uncharacterized protein LOC128991276 isoform X2 [Macrosteles quadrilineatus]
MDTGMSSGGSLTESVMDSEEDDRAFIEITELDRLLGLPPPRFDLGAADIDPRVLEADNSNSFDPEIEFALPHKPGLPRRMDLSRASDVETEVCYDKKSSKVSVTESVGEVPEQYLRMEAVPPASVSGQDEMLYKRSKTRGQTGVLNRVVSKLLAKSDSTEDNILQNLLLDSTSCDKPTIPPPVINRLKKLGTSVEVEQPLPSNGQADPTTGAAAGATAFLQIMQSLDKAVGLTSDLTKKKKKKSSNNQVPSLQLLAEIDNSDNMTKFSFQVDSKQVIELHDGQKVYTCDICLGVYNRGFSLKRHYLKTHINYKHISKRDLHNCGILFDPSIEKLGGKKKIIKEDSPPVVSNLSPPNDIPDLYRCHTCGKCYMLRDDLQQHLMDHLPVSVQNLNDDQFKNYSCPNCKARYQKKKLFLRHKEMCGKEVEPELEDTTIHYCLYCEKSFPTFLQKKKHHLQLHHPKKKLHQCYLCKTKMFKERLGVFKHLLLHHPDEYIGCLSCKLRFGTREEYKKHNKENHKTLGTAKKLLIQQKLANKPQGQEESVESRLSGETEKALEHNNNPNLVLKCTECPKMFACFLNMTRHRRIAHRLKKKKKVLKKDYAKERALDNRKTPTPPPPILTPSVPQPTPTPPPDPELLFYSTIAHNIRENLTHHLDGKLDSQEVMEYDLNKASSAEGKNKVLNFSAGASFSSPTVPADEPEATSTPVQQKEAKTIPISPRAPWEKFSFPKNYDGRCGLTSYIKDMSHLDISTQLTMRRNLQRLNSMAGQEANKESPANIPAGLLLVERPVPDCAEAFGEPDTDKDKEGGNSVLSGEWVRPRRFLCSVCGFTTTCLWEVEDHKYAQHPNVWVPHVEIVHEQSSAWDWFYYRRLPPQTPVEYTTPAPLTAPLSCSKCGRQSTVLSDLHRHMLECGGDTSWQSLVGASGGRRRKWRFGSRRRKHQGRRMLKRNIPNTPAKHSCGRIRTKPGDMDTIQKMIANLPAKRTRRAIGEDLEIKTRSQATINSVPISSLATHSSAARHSAIKASKVGKGNTKVNSQKKVKTENIPQEEKTRNKEIKIKTEPLDSVPIKEEAIEKEFQPLEAENMVQHSDILTSLQMIRVVRESTEEHEKEKELVDDEPIETSKILAAMREAMLESSDKIENRMVTKADKRKKAKTEEKQIKTEPVWDVKKPENDSELIICNGCGMQFDNASSCHRHKKKCVYWKEDKNSEDKQTNKCTQCGCVFPYLMALLKHNCSRSEEPAMPQLCPEEPVAEVLGDSVEDIPILSPVDISRDETVRRMSLVDATVSLVSDESFDISQYHHKYFKSLGSDKNEVSGKKKEPNVKKVKSADDQTLEEKVEKSVVSSVETPKTTPLVKSPGSDQRNKKVTEIFKEIKRRGRKRKLKVKITNKLVSTKVGLRKPGLKMTNALIKKNQMKRKKRSNFLMLMNEFEKLQKEGAVAVGKRKRICSNSELSFRSVRSRRQIVPTINHSDYADIDSVISDLSDLQDIQAFVQSSDRKSTRRTNSIGNDDMMSSTEPADFFEIPPENTTKEVSTEGFDQSSNVTKDKIVFDLQKEIKQEPPVVQKRKPGRPPRPKIITENKQDVRNSIILNNENCASKKNPDDKVEATVEKPIKIEKEEYLSENISQAQDITMVKRKPGRPRFKSITEETDQHIKEAIDTVIKKTIGCSTSEDSNSFYSKETGILDRKVIENDKVDFLSSEVIKPNPSSSQEALSNEGTEEHIQEAIESVLSQNHDAIAISREVDWTKIDEIIYNVSIGSAEIMEESENPVPCPAASKPSQPLLMRRKRKKRKKIFTKFFKGYQNKYLKERLESNPSRYPSSVKDKVIDNTKSIEGEPAATTSTVKTDCSTSNKIPKDKPADTQSSDQTKNSVNVPNDESKPSSVKSKEVVKTKQLSIEDYLTIKHYVKGANITAVKENEKKSEEGWKVSNNINETVKDVNISSIKTKEVSKSLTAITTPCEDSRTSTSKPLKQKPVKHHEPDDEVVTNLKPLSPSSTSSREDIVLSVIKDKVIKKKRKKLKLKKLLKNKHIDIMDSKISKITKPKIARREDRQFLKEKLSKKIKKIEVGVSRNRWEVSVVENKNKSQVLCEESETKSASETAKKFYCSVCDVKFESSYNLYEHQLTAEHKLKSTVAAVNKSNLSEESDPVKYCKSIGNIINDLEKRTLNVAKVMHQLKQKDGSDGGEPGAVVESTSSPAKEEWGLGIEWWEGAPLDDNSCTSSLGTLMVDTVNKLLSSDQDPMVDPPYSLSDLQLAMGASDEEMAMLFQLGEHTLQEEYVYDSSRPAEEGPTLTDLDHQTVPATTPTLPLSSDSLLEVRKQEPLSDSEDSKAGSCRGVGKMLGDYENREMVCPTCNKHFLGLAALQTHVAWSHCAPVTNASRLKRRALLNSEEVDRRLVCFVCKEIVPTASQLEAHIQAQHTKKIHDSNDTPKPMLSEAAEKLRSKMSLALGGLVDRALNKLLGTGRALIEPTTSNGQPSQADLNTGALQLLGRLCAAKKRFGSENVKLSAETIQLLGRLRAVSHKDESARPYSSLAEEMRTILARGRPLGVSKGALAASVHSNTPCSSNCGGCSGSGTTDLKPTNLLDHLAVCSSDVQERPYACPICELRFLIPSTRNRHIARAHGKYGRRYDEEVEETLPNEDQDQDWKSPMDLDMDGNDDGEMLPLCSDCGLSFQSIHEVMRHRIEDHPRRFSADFQEEENPKMDKVSVVESSCETKEASQTPKSDVKMLPVSDSAIDSTSTVKRKRGRPAKLIPKSESKSSSKKKCPDDKICSPNRKGNRSVGRIKKQSNDNEEEHEDSEFQSEDESVCESSREESSNTESNSPETDKSSEKITEKLASRTSSEENLAELSKKLDRRKVRMGNMAEETVKIKAEAALRELNLAKKQKSPSSAAKWGINAVKFTKNSPSVVSSSQLNGSPSKPRFASLGEKKWKIPSGTGVEPPIKVETIDVKPDIYDFRDEELETNKKPASLSKEFHSPDSEHSDSNKPNSWSVSGSPRKAARLNLDNS